MILPNMIAVSLLWRRTCGWLGTSLVGFKVEDDRWQLKRLDLPVILRHQRKKYMGKYKGTWWKEPKIVGSHHKYSMDLGELRNFPLL